MGEKNTKNGWIVPLLLIVLIVAGSCGYFIGTSASTKRYKAEKEQEVLLNRSELALYDEVKGPIYVTGHKTPDSDTVGAAIGYANLLQKLGYDAHAVVLGKINAESEFILKAAKIETPKILEDASGLNMILVDHSEYMQSAPGLQDAKIIAVIDHHGVGSIFTGNQLIYDARPLCSANTIVWFHYRNYGVEIDKQTAIVMLGAILSDTGGLKFSTTTAADKAAGKNLADIAGITDIDAFYDEMRKFALSYTGMSDEEIFFSDYKEYLAGDKKFAIATIQVYDKQNSEKLAPRLKAVIPGALVSRGMDMSFIQLAPSPKEHYLIASDEAAEEVLKIAFGEKLKREENFYVLTPGVSRRSVLVPEITNVLESHPTE